MDFSLETAGNAVEEEETYNVHVSRPDCSFIQRTRPGFLLDSWLFTLEAGLTAPAMPLINAFDAVFCFVFAGAVC